MTAATALLVSLVSLVGFAGFDAVPPRVFAAPSSTADSWPTYLHDAQRTGASADLTLSTANVAGLTALWSSHTGGMIATQPAVVNGVAYIGSWDGYEYALSAATGAVIWRTNLGTTTGNSTCYPAHLGISSAATMQNGVVYVGGGDAYWYALDATSGAVLWRVFTGDNSAAGGHYNWSSPLIYNGYAYIGIASLGDCPLVQGQLLQVDLTSHQVVHTLNIVPNGQVGGGIWTSPSLDPVTNTLYLTTGTLIDATQALAQAVLAVDASSLAITSAWQIPQIQTVSDSDWGTTPILFADQNGRQLVAAVNKNGYVYAFLRSNLGGGPVWQQQIAIGGPCPPCGDGTAASMAFGNGLLYVAGGNTLINGIGYPGAVRALDPATGAYVWQHPDPAPIIPALVYDNGLVIAGPGASLEALDAATGNRLYSFTTGAALYGPPAIANGTIYFGSTDDNVYALGLPPTPPPPPPADPRCPTGWTCQDIGNPAPTGAESVAGSTWTLMAGGSGIVGTSDHFRLISQAVSSDTQLSAQMTGLTTTASGAQVGLILRQSAAPGSPYFAVLAMPNNTVRVQYRAVLGGVAAILNTVTAPAGSLYLEIQRTGDLFQAALSSDGTNYTLIPGTSTSVVMPLAVLAGVAASSGAQGTAGSGSVSAVSLASPTAVPSPSASPSPCPAGWSCGDVGNPALVGTQALSNGVWTIRGTGYGIASYADQFHFVSQPLAADGTIRARVTAQTNTSANAQSGIMLRLDATAGAPFYGAFLTPGNGLVVAYRTTQGLRAVTPTSLNATAPVYLQVARSGNSFSTYSSSDGVTWSYVPNSSVILNMSGTLRAGLAVTSANTGASSTANFDSVTLANSSPPPPVACPAGWSCADIGNATPSGSDWLSNGTWNIEGGGYDIWSTFDKFHFDWQPLAGDGTFSAHLASQANTDPWAKAGLMFRASTDPAASFYDVVVTPSNGITVQYRTATAANAQTAARTKGGAPTYLKIGRSGTAFSAYTSSDGATWTLIPGSTVTIASLTGTLLAGFADTSHNGGTVSLVTFDTFAFSTCAAGWTCADVGTPTLAGGQSISGGAWTLQGGGNDIWDAADQFHFAWQPLASDGAVSAHVTSQTTTDPWAKAGVMFRAGTNAGDPFYDLVVTPGNGLAVQVRATAGGAAQNVISLAGTVPAYLKIGRSGTTFTAYTSTDGATWTLIPGSTVTIASLTGTLLAGLAVTAHNGGALGSAMMDSVAVSNCPAGWSCADVGGPALAGGQSVTGGAWTIQGAGSDIWNTADQFHFAWQPLAADGGVSAHLTSQTTTSSWAKAGVMLRLSTDPSAPFYAIFVTPGNGLSVQYRAALGASAQEAVRLAGAVPAYLRVLRAGTTLTAYTSADGVTWTAVPGSALTLPALTGSLASGLAVTSHNTATLSTATFDTVAFS